MKKSFDHITNSWLYRLCKTIGDIVIISALFLLFCIPVITIGASASALYYTVYRKYVKKIDSVSHDFMHSLKDNLKNGIILNLIYLIFSAAVGFNIYFAFCGMGDIKLPDWYTVVSLLPLIPIIFTFPFVYPLTARFQNSIKATITNSFTLCMMNFPKFLLIWLIIIMALAITIAFPPAVLVTPAAAAYLIQMITEKAFQKAMNVKKTAESAAAKKDSQEDTDTKTSAEDEADNGSDDEDADDEDVEVKDDE